MIHQFQGPAVPILDGPHQWVKAEALHIATRGACRALARCRPEFAGADYLDVATTMRGFKQAIESYETAPGAAWPTPPVALAGTLGRWPPRLSGSQVVSTASRLGNVTVGPMA